MIFVVLWKQPLEAPLQNRCSTNLSNIEKRLWRSATLLKLNSFTDILQGFCQNGKSSIFTCLEFSSSFYEGAPLWRYFFIFKKANFFRKRLNDCLCFFAGSYFFTFIRSLGRFHSVQNVIDGFKHYILFILILCSEIPFSKNSYHIETSLAISKANKLTGFYTILTRCSQADCSISLFSPRQLKRILCKHGLFRSKSNLPFTTLCDIVQVRYVFCGFSFFMQSVDSRNYSHKEVNNKSQNYKLQLFFPVKIQDSSSSLVNC